MYRAGLIAEVVPGLVLVASSYLASLPAFRITRQSNRGRARGAMAWLCGFLTGVLATVILTGTLDDVAAANASLSATGLLGAFVGPFVGIAHGKWLGPIKRRRRPAELREAGPN